MLKDFLVSEIKRIGINEHSVAFRYILNIAIRNAKYSFSNKEVKQLIRSIVKEIIKFYSNPKSYAKEIAREEYAKLFKLDYGSFKYSIKCDRKYVKIELYSSISDYPLSTILFPKLTNDQLKKLEAYLQNS